MYPNRKDSERESRITYQGSKEVNSEITKEVFINAIDQSCKEHPGYPLSGIADFIMDRLNLIPQSQLAQESYMLKVDVCDGRVEAFVGNGELVAKGVQMIYLDNNKCVASFSAERNSSIGRQILKECPMHSKCHVEGTFEGDSGIEVLVEVKRLQ
jgi:hypothetical protein